MTSPIVDAVVNAAAEAAPDSPAVEAAAAVVATIASPSPETILADLEAAHKIIADFKARMAGLHPSIRNLLKAIF